ncbi:fungal-specific transcription factor domain-containing protein [Fusarium solani]|uniref:Fungal-specific transcription factor domain-containing protein n=1 Tax=Fusarium solani TaxID=169388 RepID=A0A9P9FYW5_FUSSL|nr:fungal-specific transcription factor domain-containing protein [Fusarium solani]KAH7230260.1 fungal-specific transcription factor domain-containing protein [Fusarium solani]
MDTGYNDEHSQIGGDNGFSETQVVQSFGGRRRTRRACDRCNALRVRCDGQKPCIGRRGRKPSSRKATRQSSGSRTIRQRPDDHDTRDGDGDSSEANHELEQNIHPQLRQQQQQEQRLQTQPDENLRATSRRIANHDPIAAAQNILDADESISHLYASRVPQDDASRATNNHNSFSSHTDAAPPQSLESTRTTLASSQAYHVDGNQSAFHALPDLCLATAPIPNILAAPQGPRVSVSSAHGQNRSGDQGVWFTTAPSQTTAQCRDTSSTRECRYKCLKPIVPMLEGIIDADLACELLELYFVEPGGSLFRCSSPYVLVHVLRKESLLRSTNPRRSTPALLVTMLWVSAQTVESSLFLLPGQKSRVCEGLRRLMMGLIQDRDRDLWNRTTDGPLVKDFKFPASADATFGSLHQSSPHDYDYQFSSTSVSPPTPLIDDVLMFVLLTIVVSGGDFKTDCIRWWNKALRLSNNMCLNREDTPEDKPSGAGSTMCTGGKTNAPCVCRLCEAARTGLSIPEIQEERRRVFWLIFCLDRHLALAFNAPLRILDDECQLYAPLSDQAWESLSPSGNPTITSDNPIAVDDSQQQQRHPGRGFGAPTRVSGISFFEYFLPLMTILGDVIQLHRQKCHPRFGNMRQSRNNTNGGMGEQQHDNEDEHSTATAMIEQIMADCAQSIADLAELYQVDALDGATIPSSQVRTPSTVNSSQYDETFQLGHNARRDNNDTRHHSNTTAYHSRRAPSNRQHAQAELVTAYSTFILHVLHVLLHGKWDAVSMLDNKDGWIPSVGFMKCASHAIAASDAMSRILACDPELSFMPYLFGIYLLHGSFILLLFADRMPQLGPNEAVEKACEIIIRAHEVCVVTLSTEFQVRSCVSFTRAQRLLFRY